MPDVIGQRLPRTEVHATLERRGVFRRWFRVRVNVVRFEVDGRMRRVFWYVGDWRRSHFEARADALSAAMVPKDVREPYAEAVLACR